MRESKIERYLRVQCEAKGFPCRKHVTPGRRRAFDRYVLLRQQRVIWLETKATKKALSPAQTREKFFLESFGHLALLINSKLLVDQFVEKYL